MRRPPDIRALWGRSGSYRDPRPEIRRTACGLCKKGHASTVEKIGAALISDADRVDEARRQPSEWRNPPIPIGQRLRELLEKLPIWPEHP
jgi:hypothetical protein